MNTKLQAQRGYRVIKPIELLGNAVIPAGTHMYCDTVNQRRGSGVVYYIKGDHLMKAGLLASDASNTVFAKLASLPERIRNRFGIREDGTRAIISKGKVYTFSDNIEINGLTLEPGTPLLCLKGGERPHLSFVRPDGQLDYMEASPTVRVQMQELHSVEDEAALLAIESTVIEVTYRTAGDRLVFQVGLKMEGNDLVIERLSERAEARYRELTLGAADAIVSRLQTSTSYQCSPIVMLEAYVTYLQFGKGLAQFYQLQPALAKSIEAADAQIAKSAAAKATTRSTGLVSNGYLHTYNKRNGRFQRTRLY